jgi:glycogen operon protein
MAIFKKGESEMKKTPQAFPLHPSTTPYGARPYPGGVEFRIFSRHATRVWLMLFKSPEAAKPDREIELDPVANRTGDIWHVAVPGAQAGECYLWRMDGPKGDGFAYDPEQWLLDPFAEAVAGAPEWGGAEGVVPGKQIKNGALFPKGIIVDGEFDWDGDRGVRVPLADSVIYELSVRGYTVHSSSGVKHRGTYRGLVDKIPWLKAMGVTTVELLPMHEFNEMELYWENGPRRALRNFWGYSTMAFFAPNGRFAVKNRHGEQVREFKEMVKAMHKAGLEVILDVVFNHTAEGGMGGQTFSFRGIDNPVYYMLEDDKKHYKNYTGCGNTVNCNHPVVREFIVQCLRHWVLEMHVDGFRFDLATILTRGRNGEVLGNPPVVEAIAEDPVLSGVKLIAEAWDAAGCYQVGSFPNAKWSEWNGKYRDDVRDFWRGGPGRLGAFATRLCGSPDLYHHGSQTPLKSVNYIASHDGFTMADIVSYERKHNLANCEDNRDGDNENRSANCGREGPSKDPAIAARRLRRQKNLLASLFLSRGVPMLLGGDEFGRTQQGNNNAYCQDNAISWVDWRLAKKNAALAEFARKMIAFRKAHPVLRVPAFYTGQAAAGEFPDLRWYGPDGKPAPDWDRGTAVACRIDGKKALAGAHAPFADDDNLFLAFNAGAEPVSFALPAAAKGRPWKLAFRTDDAAGAAATARGAVKLGPESLAVFVCKN